MRGVRQIAALSLLLNLLTAGSAAQESAWEHAQNTAPGTDPVPVAQRVDINRATLEELLKVPGMTPSWAGRIVRYRPYRSKTELVDRGVLTPAVYERVRNSVIAHRIEKPDKEPKQIWK